MELPLQAVLVLLVVAALAATVLRDVLSAIIVFTIFSLAASVTYVLLSAPDVALTEAAVGAGITSVLFLVTIARTVRPVGDRLLIAVDRRAAIAAVALAGVLAVGVAGLPPAGAADSVVASGPVTSYYLAEAYAETGVKNAVTAVLAAYRGFDTLGEAVVVIAAGVAVLLVLHQEDLV
ncbi:MAG: DUF4040 domain-containing protein [Haloferacaceae archaeon]|nr:DUF4040 domain-containing protein [Haloferacaceae archaeon]